MKYDEFHERLQEIKKSYEKQYNKEMSSLQDLESYLSKRLIIQSKKSKSLKSLKGLF
jgi:hypothetical protein